ncbi:MAG TPA: tetratricopeptide repeat protein, partial [Puia sp.]|nr:tetratricopeptide repeat protein [Puia sp.]
MRLGCTLLFLAAGILCEAQAPMPVLPQAMRSHLREYRAKDDLGGWIYEQIQWVAEAPAGRSALLIHAVDDAWRHPRTEPEVQAWLDLLTNEGYFQLLNGAIVPSTDAYTAAYEWARRHQEVVDPSSLLENILKPLGNNYTRLGDYEQALFIHEKALAIALAGADKEALAGVYSNLANTCSNMGQPARARDYCRQGLAVADRHSALA